jgi:hypothetical protein
MYIIKFEKQYYYNRCQKGTEKKKISAGWVQRINKLLQMIRTAVYKGQ